MSDQSSVSGTDDSIFTLEYADSVPALSKAVKSGDLKKIKKLMSKGILPQMPDNMGWTAIHCCAAENQTEALKLILKLKRKSKEYLVNLTTWENYTPLMVALKPPTASLKMVKLLLKAGADPKKYTHTKLSPLHLACTTKGNIEFVKLLVKFGADANVQEELRSLTPLHIAVCESRDLEIIKFLINLSDLNLENVYKRTAFLEACNSDFLDAVHVFLEKDKSLANLKSARPPIIYASLLGNLQMVQLLIDSGADVNCRCEALVQSKSNKSELILLEEKSFLPVHSSLKNAEIFKLLLRLTDISELQQLETDSYSFALFVLIHGDGNLFEALLQSHLPDDLKTFKSEVLVRFMLCNPYLKGVLAEKLPEIFKYNFTCEPDKVFQDLVDVMQSEILCKNIQLLHVLAQMGISSTVQSKNTVINVLECVLTANIDIRDLSLFQVTHELLSQPVLSLKQYCRITFRRGIRSGKTDWQALNLIRDSRLPDCLKRFIFFESFS